MSELKVLLVDDEIEFAGTLAERLRLRGLNASVTTDGQDALRIAREETPNVMVVDVMMPGISGLDVLRQIRENFPQLPVILLTGKGSTRDGIEGMRLGAFDYLVKPISIDDLIEKIREATKAPNSA
ncbi:response regulator transcription factor [Oleidesulfovibrio sp.]|uniref:response regulator transcription factor n=1 Tax=Oleidesulfovibrio sp. TaxID=2909707 RepID=UPI003A8B1C23